MTNDTNNNIKYDKQIYIHIQFYYNKDILIFKIKIKTYHKK